MVYGIYGIYGIVLDIQKMVYIYIHCDYTVIQIWCLLLAQTIFRCSHNDTNLYIYIYIHAQNVYMMYGYIHIMCAYIEKSLTYLKSDCK